MKNLRRTCLGLLLLCALSVPALAGDIPSPPARSGPQESPGVTGPQESPGLTGEIPCPGVTGDIQAPGFTGDIPFPGVILIIATLP
jgi:hypothetical protein